MKFIRNTDKIYYKNTYEGYVKVDTSHQVAHFVHGAYTHTTTEDGTDIRTLVTFTEPNRIEDCSLEDTRYAFFTRDIDRTRTVEVRVNKDDHIESSKDLYTISNDVPEFVDFRDYTGTLDIAGTSVCLELYTHDEAMFLASPTVDGVKHKMPSIVPNPKVMDALNNLLETLKETKSRIYFSEFDDTIYIVPSDIEGYRVYCTYEGDADKDAITVPPTLMESVKVNGIYTFPEEHNIKLYKEDK